MSETKLGPVDLLREVANSGVSFDEPRLKWVEVQIERATWEALATYRIEEVVEHDTG